MRVRRSMYLPPPQIVNTGVALGTKALRERVQAQRRPGRGTQPRELAFPRHGIVAGITPRAWAEGQRVSLPPINVGVAARPHATSCAGASCRGRVSPVG